LVFWSLRNDAESIGHADAIANDDPGLLSDPFSKQLYDLVKAGK